MSSEDLTLDTINAAIAAVAVAGQSYKIGSRTLTRANLTELRNLRNQMLEEQAATQNDGNGIRGTSIAIFSGR